MPTQQILTGALSHMKPFRNVAADVLLEAEKSCRWVRLKRNEMLFASGDRADYVYFVLHGVVRCLYHSAAGRLVTLADIGAGEIVGELAVIDGLPRTVDVVSQMETTLAAMPAATFLEILRHDQVARGILQILSRRMRVMTDRLIEISTLEVGARVRTELLRIARRHPMRGKAVAFPAPRHADLASHVSANREAVTREMVKLMRAGLIEKQQRNLIIRDLGYFRQSLSEIVADLSNMSVDLFL